MARRFERATDLDPVYRQWTGAEMTYAVSFDSMPWEALTPGIRQKVHRVGSRALRLVEYSQQMPPHWCTVGHIGHIVQGDLEIEFNSGVERFGAGDALFIQAGPEHAHRATPLSATVVALFVEDDAPVSQNQARLGDVTFVENGEVDVEQLNQLYRLIGWDRRGRRTHADTAEMLRVSRFFIAALEPEAGLIGFARVCGDPYVAQVLDVITHPDFRRRGIATICMRGVIAHLQRSQYVSVTLTDGSGFDGFYDRLGFKKFADVARIWRPSDLGNREQAL